MSLPEPSLEADQFVEKLNEIKQFLYEIERKVLDPIRRRLQLDAGLTSLNSDRQAEIEVAQEELKKYSSQIDSLRILEKKAAVAGMVLGLNMDQWHAKQAELSIMVQLAWALDDSPDGPLKKTIDAVDADVKTGKVTDTEIIALLVRASERYRILREKADAVASSEGLRNVLEAIASGISADDSIPIDRIVEIVAAFTRAVTDAQDIQIAGVQTIQDPRLARKVLSQEDIQGILSGNKSAVIEAIKIFISKAGRFIDHEPQAAQRMFEPVNFLKQCLDSSDKGWQDQISETETKINENLKKWEQADVALVDARLCMGPAAGPGSMASSSMLPLEDRLWVACGDAKAAWEAFPKHAKIREVSELIVDKICLALLTHAGKENQARKDRWQGLENSLIRQDWADGLIIIRELPGWLLQEQRQADMVYQEAGKLYSRLRSAFGDELFENADIYTPNSESQGVNLNLGDFARTNLDDVITAFRSNKEAIDREAAKRNSIRSTVWELQEYLEKAKSDEAQDQFEKFISINPQWQNDPEIIEIGKQINDRLDQPALIQKARLAFSLMHWDECIDSCRVIISRADHLLPVSLGTEIDQNYLNTYLGPVISEEVPGGISFFVAMMNQLARIKRASVQIVALWEKQEYDSAKGALDEFTGMAIGQSPLFDSLKRDISFDEKVLDWNARNQLGEMNFSNGVSLNTLANQFRETFVQLRNGAANREWLIAAKMFVAEILDFDLQKQTLWVGKCSQWLHELSGFFLKNTSAWILSLQRNLVVSAADRQLAYDCVVIIRKTKRFLNMDLNQRRWAIFSYYTWLVGNTATEDYEKIARLWRSALAELPDDQETFERFQDSRWKCWLNLLDMELEKVATNVNHPPDIWTRIIGQDPSLADYLFSPVETLDNRRVDHPLDASNSEIVVRQNSYDYMRQAAKRIFSNENNLEFVIRDLENEGGQIHRNELLLMAKSLVDGFVEKLLRSGDEFMLNNRILQAVENYIKAYHFASSYEVKSALDKCTRIITNPNQAGQILNFWANTLQPEIKNFNIQLDTLQSQIQAAKDRRLILSGLSTIHKNKLLKISGLKEAIELLDKSISDLTSNLSFLEKFAPDSDTWKKAVDPGGDKFSRNSAWVQLKNYLDGLQRRLPNQAQIRFIADCKEDIQNGVIKVLDNKQFLAQTLQQTTIEIDSLGSCLEYCFVINRNADTLKKLEENYHSSWHIWRKDEQIAQYPKYYSDVQPVYAAWNFTIAETEKYKFFIPYYKDHEHFSEIDEWLGKHFVVKDTTVADAPSFSRENWNKFWKKMEDLLRLYQGGNAILLDFILLAVYDLMNWTDWNSNAVNYQAKFDEISYKLTKVQSQTQMTTDCMQQVYSFGDDFKNKLDEQFKKNNLTFLSADQKILLGENITIIAKNGDRLLESIVSNRTRYQDLYTSFYSSFGPGTQSNLQTQKDSIHILEKLMNFTAVETFIWEKEKDKDVGVDREELETSWKSQVEPLHKFYTYAADQLNKLDIEVLQD